MIAIPAIEMRRGACLQPAGVGPAGEGAEPDHPDDVSRRWADLGFRRIHLIDLDATAGHERPLTTANAESIRSVLRTASVPVQLGGGIRRTGDIEALVGEGASQVVIGARAVEDPDWLSHVAGDFPGRVIVALGVRQRRVVSRRRTRRDAPTHIDDAVECYRGLPLAAVLVTTLPYDEWPCPADLHLMEDVVSAFDVPVLAAGGITSMGDLDALADRGVAAAVIGAALYDGTLDARTVALEFA